MAKSEANNAQNALQKEITSLRDANRTLTLKLRDIEVANDNFEQQARHQTSSLEDLESKYNVGIERGVMLEEEVKIGEQERESLRIETQRLRDELSDLKVEAEITQEKLQNAQATIERYHTRKPRALATDTLRAPSPASEASTSATTLSSPTVSTPPHTKSETSSTAQNTPPSPPLSDGSAKTAARARRNLVTPARQRTLETGTTPRTAHSTIRAPPRHSRGPSLPAPSLPPRTTPATTRRTTMRQSSRPSILNEQPHSRAGSLHQVSGLIGKAQKLEQKLYAMRSKLPAPTTTPPRASPRGSTLGATTPIPSSITLRSGRKRTSHSTTGSDQQPISRLNFSQSTTTRPEGSSISTMDGVGLGSRPSSRASMTGQPANPGMLPRPQSRTSMSGSRTPSFYSERRPRSSMSGSFAASTSTASRGEVPSRSATPGPRLGHGHSQSVSNIARSEDGDLGSLYTPFNRRTTLEKGSAIPMPSGIPRRQSGGTNVLLGSGRRASNVGLGDSVGPGAMRPSSRAGGDMAPPPSIQPQRNRKLSEVGETY
jgi:hypothetical protein